MNLNKLAVAVAAVVISTGAQSTTQSLTFSGTVSSTCAFTSTQNGVLVSTAAMPYVLTTNVNSGGMPGVVTIGFNSTPTVSLSRITGFTTSPDLDTITSPTYTTEVYSAFGQWIANGESFTRTYSTGTSDEITIDFQAATGENSKPWPIGQYLATVTITCQ
jgi:hypothetical protein